MISARELTHTLCGDWHCQYGTAPYPFCQSERRLDQRALSAADGADGMMPLDCAGSGAAQENTATPACLGADGCGIARCRRLVLEMETLGASGNAAEGEFETGQFHSFEYRMRAEWASVAAYALENCNPRDVAQLCAGILDAMQTDGPILGDPFGMVASDALFWADSAPPHELAAYGTAALDRLRGLALGLDTRKRLFARLWETFDPKDRQAFLTRVDAEGRFVRRGAA